MVDMITMFDPAFVVILLWHIIDQGLINRWAKWAIAQGGKLLGAANFHSTYRNK